MPNPTIKDVAKEAKVSTATVSLVIHNHKRISPKTKKLVMDTIKKLNYHPSRSARGLVSNKTGNIGFILTNDHFLRTEPFYTRIFLGSEFEAREKEYYLLLTTIESDFQSQKTLPRFILERNVDGVIVAGKVPNSFIHNLGQIEIPLVFIDYQPKKLEKKYSSVLIDNYNGGFLATNHLIELGHKKIAFIGGDIDHPSIKERLKGYKAAINDAKISLNNNLIIADEDYPARENGYNAAEKLLKKDKNVTAIFACNDAMAIGIMQYLKRKGIKVPDDISLIGFDDVEEDISQDPPLSTVRVFKTEMGAAAIRLMSNLINNNSDNHEIKFIPVELILRKSTKRMK